MSLPDCMPPARCLRGNGLPPATPSPSGSPRLAAVGLRRQGQNVVGSRGSVLPLFSRLIANGAGELPITDPRMTRFWITLEQGVDFVLKGFARMYGGELFVPKIPSLRITDLARAMAPALPQRTIGIRPGEKLHELMIPRDDSLNTLEFADHYVICPAIRFIEQRDYASNGLGERGQPVAEGFEYSSDKNPRFLSLDEIIALNGQP